MENIKHTSEQLIAPKTLFKTENKQRRLGPCKYCRKTFLKKNLEEHYRSQHQFELELEQNFQNDLDEINRNESKILTD